jgi:hypothetical protein
MKHILMPFAAAGLFITTPESPALAIALSSGLQAPVTAGSTPTRGRKPAILDRVDSVVSWVVPSTPEADSFPDAAVNRRFRVRRDAIATMQRELRAMVVAESTVHARTGFWEVAQNLTAKDFDWDRFNRGRNVPVEFQLTMPDEDPERSGWWYTIANQVTDFRCTVFVGRPDIVFPGAREGEPFCRPDSIAGVPNQPPPYTRPARLDPPPPMPWGLDIRCVGKGCQFERLSACTDIVLTRAPDPASGAWFTWKKGEERSAGGEEVQVRNPGMVVVRRSTSTPVRPNDAGVETLRFSPGDTLYTMAEAEDGSYQWYYRRKLWRGARFWDRNAANRSASAVQVRRENIFWTVAIPHTIREQGYFQPRSGLVSGMRPSEGDSLARCADPVWITSTRRFTFYSDPWLNLHQLLYEWARSDKGLAFGRDSIPMDERLEKRLSPSERQAWDSSLAFYREHVASRHETDDTMVRQATALLGLGGKLGVVPPEVIPGVGVALMRAMPVYQHWWWAAHNRMNRDRTLGDANWLRSHEDQFVETVERAFGIQWPSEPLRADHSYYSSLHGGYTAGTLMVGYTNDIGGYSSSSAETLLRASLKLSSIAAGPREALSRAFREARVPEPRHLWDAIVYATAGEFVRSTFLEDRIPMDFYSPTWIKNAFGDLPDWEKIAKTVQETWSPVVRGEVSRQSAYAALVERFNR